MSLFENFRENLFSAARMLSRAPGGEALDFGARGGAFYGGTEYAGENYALFTEQTEARDVRRALDFFEEHGLDFVAPILPGTDGCVVPLLEFCGIKRQKLYCAMAADLIDFKSEADAPRAAEPRGERAILSWAEAVWLGFGGKLPIPDDYLAFASHLARDGENVPLSLQKDGRTVCTALLHGSAGGICGLYYFATVPELRRKGLATRMMNGIAGRVSHSHGELYLLATEEGRPFYENFGFRALADVPIYSAESDL